VPGDQRYRAGSGAAGAVGQGLPSQPQLHRYPDPGEDLPARRAGAVLLRRIREAARRALAGPPVRWCWGDLPLLARSRDRSLAEKRLGDAPDRGFERVSFEIRADRRRAGYEPTWRRNGWCWSRFRCRHQRLHVDAARPRHRGSRTQSDILATSGCRSWRSIRFGHHGAAPAAALRWGLDLSAHVQPAPHAPVQLQEAPAHQGSPHPNQIIPDKSGSRMAKIKFHTRFVKSSIPKNFQTFS